jgi:hypothetical protein
MENVMKMGYGEPHPIATGRYKRKHSCVALDAAMDVPAFKDTYDNLMKLLQGALSPDDLGEAEAALEHLLELTSDTEGEPAVQTAQDAALRRLAPTVRAGNPEAIRQYVALSRERAAQRQSASLERRFPGATRLKQG